MAVTTLEKILAKETPEGQPRIRSVLGRVFLQLGDVEAAAASFGEAQRLRAASGASSSEDTVDQAFLSIAQHDYSRALSLLKDVHADDNNNPVVINNMSVCLLYLGRLKEALALLESNLTKNPPDFLRETQVLNLATLYELESSYAVQKKQSLLDFMSRYTGDGANTSCLKF